MCRLLLVKAEKDFEISNHLKQLAEISKNSKEYQGHGWGCAYLKDNNWEFYKNIKPIWEDNLEQFDRTMLLIAHARSAYKDENIRIENNMPFHNDEYVFIFNGELQGVKIKEHGRIGAEKVFNFVKRFDKGNILEALKSAVKIIKKRTRYVKAMNMIILNKQRVYVASIFNENPKYFTMHYKKNNKLIICSEPYAKEKGWRKIENNTIRSFR